MFALEDLEKYEKQFSAIDLNSLTSWGKHSSDLEKGLLGEEKVFSVLSKYTDRIYRDVVVWNRKHTMVTEADFAAELNGFLLIGEVKEWFGTISVGEQKEKVDIAFENLQGRKVVRTRTSPVYSIASFTSDFNRYLRPDEPKKDTQELRYVVFSRDDLIYDESFLSYNTSIRICKLDEFDESLKELSHRENLNPYCLKKDLPSWDYYFSENDNKWYKFAIICNEIETSKGMIPVSQIDSMLLADEIGDESIIKLIDGSIIKAAVDRRSIRINTKHNYAMRFIYRFIKVNQLLHAEQE